MINGYDDISESTRRKVLQAIRELNYHPNSIARNLLLQRSHTVGVVTVAQQSISHPLFNQLIVALAAAVEEADLGIALTVYDPETDSVDGCLQRWHEQRLEGIVVIGMAEESPLVQAVARSKIPAVFVDTQASGPKATWIASDNRQGAYEAVTHLLRLGHRKIAFLQGVPNGRIIRDRYEGYKQALQDAGLPADDTLYEQADFTKEGAYRAAERLFARTVPTAIFCVSDLMAFGVMQWARDKGIAVPDGLAVVGFDDDPAGLIRLGVRHDDPAQADDRELHTRPTQPAPGNPTLVGRGPIQAERRSRQCSRSFEKRASVHVTSPGAMSGPLPHGSDQGFVEKALSLAPPDATRLVPPPGRAYPRARGR